MTDNTPSNAVEDDGLTTLHTTPNGKMVTTSQLFCRTKTSGWVGVTVGVAVGVGVFVFVGVTVGLAVFVGV